MESVTLNARRPERHRSLCSTPSGIMESVTITPSSSGFSSVRAQRLPASWNRSRRNRERKAGTGQCSTPSGIMESVTVNLRHRRRAAYRAQRLPASWNRSQPACNSLHQQGSQQVFSSWLPLTCCLTGQFWQTRPQNLPQTPRTSRFALLFMDIHTCQRAVTRKILLASGQFNYFASKHPEVLESQVAGILHNRMRRRSIRPVHLL